MSVNFEKIQTRVAKENKNLIELRRHFHQYPESSLKEYRTSEKIQQELTNYGIVYEKVGETGIIATIKGREPGKTILLRADIDALEVADDTQVEYQSRNEGLNHACGHDGHIAALLIAGKILAESTDEFKGTVKLVFQPAEEIGAGARLFVQAGHLDDVDQVFGLHLDAHVPVGKLVAVKGATNASCDIFKIKVKGEGAHASRPDLGKDAALAAASILVELQKIVAREINPLDPIVIGVGKIQAGTRYNIIASHAVLEGTIRTFSHETRAFAQKRVAEIAQAIADAHRVSVEFENYDAAAPLINEKKAAELAAQVAKKLVGNNQVITDQEKSLGADDFADFLAVVPGVYGRVGTRDQNNVATQYSHHHEKFNIDERSLYYAACYHIGYALSFFENEI